MKKITRKQLVKKLDKIFSEFIRKRDGKCIVCGSTENLQAGHLFSRVNHSTRWSEINTNAQCRGCNMRHEYEFEPYRKAFIKKYNQSIYDMLYIKHKGVCKFSNSDLITMINYYKNEVKK